ncbi:MAG: alpha/beta fold hydrolase [Jatrophihabitans sp.]
MSHGGSAPTEVGEAGKRSFQTSDGRALSYEIRGSGKTLILLPGGPGLDPSAFFANVELPGIQQLVFCPRGTGDSDPPGSPDGYRIAGYVQDVEELRGHLGVEQLTLCGSSHGASVALAYAGSYPHHVDRMILAAGPARMDGSFLQALEEARERFRTSANRGSERLDAADIAAASLRTAPDEDARRRSLRMMMECFVAHPGPKEAAYLDRLSEAPVNFAAPGPMGQEIMSGLDLLRESDKIRAPALILSGELDARVPSAHMQEISDTLPDARFIRFPDVGHLIHVEAGERWGTALRAFLQTR